MFPDKFKWTLHTTSYLIYLYRTLHFKTLKYRTTPGVAAIIVTSVFVSHLPEL